ncbi:MAG: hypothetical protein ACRC4W_00155 [Treponemataceae bacterium]
MAQQNVKGNKLARGVNCKVRMDPTDPNGSNPVIVGFVSDAQINKAIQNDKAKVVGSILPVSIDATAIETTVSLNGFVPSKALKEQGVSNVDGGGKITLDTLNTDDDKTLDEKVLQKIPYLDLYDEKHGSIIGATTWLSPTSYNVDVKSETYIRVSCGFDSIGFKNGSDYKTLY